MADQKDNSPALDEQKVVQQVLTALKGMRFGTVQVTVHNGRVTQIDKIERIRVAKEETI